MDTKPVPQRGDGFDASPSSGQNLPANISGAGAPSTSPFGNIALDKLGLAELAATLGTDERSAQIIKDALVASGGAMGAVGMRRLNAVLGNHLPEEVAAAVGAALGAYGTGLLSKKVGRSSVGRRRRR